MLIFNGFNKGIELVQVGLTGAESSSSRAPLHFFFIERYRQAYLDQFDAFIETIENQQQPLVGFEDGRRALMLANAAYQSLEKGQAVKVDFGE